MNSLKDAALILAFAITTVAIMCFMGAVLAAIFLYSIVSALGGMQ